MSTAVCIARRIIFLSSFKGVITQQRFASNIQNHFPVAGAVQLKPERSTKQDTVPRKTADTRSINKYIFSMDDNKTVFKGVVDRFNGVTIDSKEEIAEITEFPERLQSSLEHWIQNAFRGIWFKVHTEHAQVVPELVKNGFDFHHAKSGYVMMFRWLPQQESVNIPHCAHTLVGVGGLVINDKNEVLSVSDRFALIPNSWKLPGGYVEPKEDLVDAAIREVREETGVETIFDTMVALRHSHGGTFDCSDMYFVIGLKPQTDKLTACEREISKVQWMAVDEFLVNPNVHETNRHFVRTYLQYKRNGIKLNCTTATHQILKRQYTLYSLEKEAESRNSL